MFKTSISATALTTAAANMFFTNIVGDSYGNDVTFLATLRALVAPRMPEGDSVRVSFGRTDYSAIDIANSSGRSMVQNICRNMARRNGEIYIHNLARRSESDNDANIDLLKRKFCEVYSGWQYHEKITTFYQKSFKVICFINPEAKSVALFVDQMNLQKLHYLQMSILAFLPWYFDPANGMTDEEMELVKSLRERTSEKYEECVKAMAEKYDFESGRIRYLLAEFETKYEREEQSRVQRDIESVDRSIRDYNSAIGREINKKRDLEIKLMGLKYRVENSGPSELMEYFLRNKGVYLCEVSGTSMTFIAKGYMEYFDEEAAERYIENRNSYVYADCREISKDDMEKLMRAIFIDQDLKIRTCAAYQFDMRGHVDGLSHYRFCHECDGYKPNPHIDEYSCLGNYTRIINDALSRGDYVSAIVQCEASARSINFHDSPVMNRFISNFVYNGGRAYKAIELPTGDVVTPREALDWMKAQEEAEKIEAEKAAAEQAAADTAQEPASAEVIEVAEDTAERIAAAAAAEEQVPF